jgi:hypothetical protein
MDRKRIAARDRRTAAVHEARHIIVARHCGCQIASAWIVPTDHRHLARGRGADVFKFHAHPPTLLRDAWWASPAKSLNTYGGVAGSRIFIQKR